MSAPLRTRRQPELRATLPLVALVVLTIVLSVASAGRI